MKKVRDISTVISSVTFSPESGGKLNPKTAMLKIKKCIFATEYLLSGNLAISTQGPIKLEK